MTGEHVREVLIVGILTAAALVCVYLDAHQLAAMMGGAACALVVPRAGTVARASVVLAATVGGSLLLHGCGGAPVPARAACRGAAALIAAVCEHVPETVGGQSSP